MKKFVLVLVGVLLVGGATQAKTKKPATLPVQTMCMDNAAPACPMMESMPVMIQVLKLQQKLDEGATGAERKQIVEDKAKLIGVLDAASAQTKGMPCMTGKMPCMQPGATAQMPCAPQNNQPCPPAPKK